MIETTSLTALNTAFRAEVIQNSISPEKVGSILQQIVDLLAIATPDSDMSQLAVLRQRLMSITTISHHWHKEHRTATTSTLSTIHTM